MSGAWNRVEGFQALADWYGGTPGFHDGEMLSLTIDFPGEAVFQVSGWRTTNRVDEQGYFEHEKHFVAVFRLEGLSLIDLESDYEGGTGIIGSLGVIEAGEGIELQIFSVLGVGGRIRARGASITFAPGKPA